MAKDPYRYFRGEARELLDQLGSLTLELENGATAALVAHMLRIAHTLKGAARVVKQSDISEQAHWIEGALAPYRDRECAVPRNFIDDLLHSLDTIRERIVALDGQNEVVATENAAFESTGIRADAAIIDVLLDSLGEIGAELDAIRTNVADSQRVTGSVERIERELVQTNESAWELRLVPASTVFHALERTARDAARDCGKTVIFTTSGGEIRLDAAVLETVRPALVQLVRNAVTHGIESEAERMAAGKEPAGSISIQVTRRGNRVAFRCRDDGRGINFTAVRAILEQKGISAESVDEKELLRSLLRGGISTSTRVSEFAGRGIGLDVVRDVAASLGGEARAETAPGLGTTVEVQAFVSLAALDVLLLEAGGQRLAIPLDAVRRVMRVSKPEITRRAGEECIAIDGVLVPLVPLSLYGNGIASTNGHAVTAVLIESAGATTAVTVDRVLETTSIVLRPLTRLAAADHAVLGTHLDAQGNPSLVLDPNALAHLPRSQRDVATGTQPAARVDPILVVDDSLTTRMLETSILESAGFDVAAACSGEEALELARSNRYSLFLVDVEMPGMDGFTFIDRVRTDASLGEIPCVLVTSRESREDRERAVAVGARGHIVKGEFDQSSFLAHVNRLVRK